MAKIETLLLQALLEDNFALYTPVTLLGNAFLEGPEAHPQKYFWEIRSGGPWKHRPNVPLVLGQLLRCNSSFRKVRIVTVEAPVRAAGQARC